MHENQAPVMFYDVRNGRNAGDTYKSNKLNVYEWTKVEEIAGYLQVAAFASPSQMMDAGANIQHQARYFLVLLR